MSDEIIILEESWIESAKRDIFSVVCAFALILPGVYLESDAMQWLGVLLFGAVIVFRASGVRKRATRTHEEAIQYIQQKMKKPGEDS